MAAFDNNTLYWLLDEASGNRTDIVSSVVLTDVATVGSTSDPTHGTVAVFTKADSDALSNTSFSSYGSDDGYSISMWIKHATMASDSYLWALIDGGVADTDYLFLDYSGSPDLTHEAYNYGATSNADATIDDDGWHHIAYTVGPDSAGRDWNLYVDGSVLAQGFGVSADTGTTLDEFHLGYDGNAVHSNVEMMKVGYWKAVVIDSTQVTALYNSGTPPSHPSEGGGGGGIRNPLTGPIGLRNPL